MAFTAGDYVAAGVEGAAAVRERRRSWSRLHAQGIARAPAFARRRSCFATFGPRQQKMTVRGNGRDLGALGQPGAVAGDGIERGVMAQALAALFAAGATLALLTIALPHPRAASELGLLVIIGIAYAVAATLFWRARTLAAWVLPVALGWGSTLVTAVAYFSGQSPSPLVFFYLWVFLYSSYFFTSSETVVQIVYVGLAYGALLAVRTPAAGIPEWWLVVMGTMTVAAILVRSMRTRAEALITGLYAAARTDPLTKLSNRQAFREMLDLELERARRGRSSVTVAVGDLDHFKEVNDRLGRDAGDAVLLRLARVLAAGRRQLDGVARVGGEQFALILSDTDPTSGLLIAERLRGALAEEFRHDSQPITISFGVASFPEHGQTAGSLLRAADEALYAAKRNGRDRSVLHSAALRNVARQGGHPRDVAGERFVAVVLDLAEAVDLRFSGSARHSETVGRYAAMMASELGLSQERIERVRLAGMLHDVGKVGVPDSILSKPAQLTDEEFAVIKRHPELGAQILEHPGLTDVRQWVGAHHERPDGRGYPCGLAGEKIPIEARILAVADAYEAMTSDRAYRAAIGPTAAREELRRCVASQFDGRVVQALLTVLDREGERLQTTLAHS
jgi:diguanylate cyclase (GGDEF)-like protein/putative nucleotidyltransferase with HDIG domain